MSDNPLSYKDLFDFSDNGGIKAALRDIKKLKDLYKEFAETVTAGMFKSLTDQQNALAASVRELAEASKALNITQKDQQAQLIANAAAMNKLDAANKQLEQTQKAAKTTNDAVKGSVDQLTAQLKAQVAQYNALGQTKQRDIDKAAKLVQSINTTRAQLSTLNGAIKQNIVAFTSAQGSYNRLDAETKKLIIDLKNLPDAFGANAKKAKEMQAAINANITKLKEFDKAMNISTRNVGNYSSAFSQIGSSIMSMIGPLAIFTASLRAVSSIIKSNAEISDSLSDIRRTAQLTESEADNLVTTLKKIDTRTSLKGLLDISIIAGQLGIAKKDIAAFTESIDQLSVVLSKEIPGGAEEVATALGKINGVFKVQQKDGTDISEAYNKTGSAILALGQVGLATGAYLQDFALRTAGIAQTAKISLPTILAYSAVLEETGSSAEVAGTAFNRLVGSLASKREKFFAIAKLGDATLTLKQFTDTINTDANKALQQFFKGLNQGKNLTQFTDLLGEIKIKAGPAQNAIIALAQNQDKLNERIGQSVSAYNDGGLAADQFALKNNNLAGSLDKLGNAFTNISTDPTSKLGRAFKFIVDSITDAINALERFDAQASEDKVILRRVRNGKSGVGFTGSGIQTKQDVQDAIARESKRQNSIYNDELRGQGVEYGRKLVANTKNEIELNRTLQAQYSKLYQISRDRNKALEVKKQFDGIVSTSEQQNINKLSAAYARQTYVVGELTRQKNALYGRVAAPGDGDKFKPVPKQTGKTAEQLEKENADRLNRLYQAQAKYEVSVTELEFKEGNDSVDQQIRFEETKLKILNGSFEKRLKLYKKDSIDYVNIQTEQVDAQASASEKIGKIKKAEQEAEIKRLEAIAKAQQNVNRAQSSKNDTVFDSNLRKDVSKGKISQDTADQTSYEYYRSLAQFELEQQQEALSKLKFGDADYLETKRNILELEKELIKNKTDFEISEDERAARKKHDLQQSVFNYTEEIGNALLDITSSFRAGEEEELQKQYEKDTENAGNNAEAKKKIEEDYQKKSNALKRKQAIFDKAQALFNIGIQTAMAVISATSLPPIGLGPVLGIPFAIKAAVSGAIQAAVVLAKPIPKYKGGRKGGKAEFAVVNDGRGPEAITDKKGNIRFAGRGEETVTYLNDGDNVHTHEQTRKMFLDSKMSDDYINSMIMGTKVIARSEDQKTAALARAMQEARLSPEDIEKAFSSAAEKLPFDQNLFDERGFSKFKVTQNSKIQSQNDRNRTGGNG